MGCKQVDAASSSSRGSSRGEEMASLGSFVCELVRIRSLQSLLLQICEGVFRVLDFLSMTLFYSFLFFPFSFWCSVLLALVRSSCKLSLGDQEGASLFSLLFHGLSRWVHFSPLLSVCFVFPCLDFTGILIFFGDFIT